MLPRHHAARSQRELQPLFAAAARFLRPFPLGDVLHGADHTNGGALLVADDEAAVEDVGIAAVAAREPVLVDPARFGAVDDAHDAVDDALPVLGMHHRG